jgi:hypothetical protein
MIRTNRKQIIIDHIKLIIGIIIIITIFITFQYFKI